MRLVFAFVSLAVIGACTAKVGREELTGNWYMTTLAMSSMGLDGGLARQPSLVLNYNATFTAHNFPANIIYNGGRADALFEGSGTWWIAELGGFQTVMLDFENVRGGSPAVAQVIIDREHDKPYLFVWHDEEGSNRIKFDRAK